ncbi:MAG: bifunctional adenosylcobinamide kinase/adenosylcobinamide-phosphate guanylyltransferase [Chitinophagales bacterium]
MSSITLKINDLTCSYAARTILKGLTFEVNRAELIGIVGPNGSGKSTLLKSISNVLKPRYGEVLLQGEKVRDMKRRQVAQKMAVVSQEEKIDFPITVQDVVLMGRYPYLERFSREKIQDIEKVEEALDLTGLKAMANRDFTHLSAGEKQRVLIARALAQEPEVLLLDEPTSNLDVGHQVEIMDLIGRLRKEKGLTVIMAVHDLNLASGYCDRLLVLKDGRIYLAGKPDEVLTPGNIFDIYGSRVTAAVHPISGRPQVMLIPDTDLGNSDREQIKRGHLILITGGARSGKSTMAEKLATNLGIKGKKVVYIATASAGDEEMKERIARHRQERPTEWETVEETLQVEEIIKKKVGTAGVILIDCLTLLVSNWLLAEDIDWDREGLNRERQARILDKAKRLARTARQVKSDVIMVTNEVGFGLVPDNSMGRAYRDVLGLVNQIMAADADEVYLLCSGIPLRVKDARDQIRGS